MTQPKTRLRAALFLSTAALLATPTLAQVAPAVETPVAPPPVAPTAPQGNARAGQSPTPVNAEAAAQAAAEDAAERTARRSERRRFRPTRRTRYVARATAPVAAATPSAAPIVAPSPAPAASATPSASEPGPATPVATPTAAPPTPQPAETAVASESTTERTPAEGPPMWPLALLALLVIAGGVWFILSRRRKADGHDEWADTPLTSEPVVHHEPVAAQPAPTQPGASVAAASAAAGAAGVMVNDRPTATPATHTPPVVAEDATVATPDGDDVAALTAADTTGTRPWLEFAMRPVRAGTSADEVLVEIELTVANAGNSIAEDVRISTFMLPAGNDGDLDRMLVKGDDTAVAPLTLAAGEGTRVDATLAMPRASLPDGGTFRPVVVADARYRLPGGGEGRTSAAFLIGGANGDTIDPIDLDTRAMREDVGAQLYRDPVRV